MSKAVSQRVLIFTSVFVLLAVAIWRLTTFESVSAEEIASPTHSQPYAHAEIIKPTYTLAPTQLPTTTPEPAAEAKLVVDTSIDASVAQSDPNAPAPVNYASGKSILVDISEQHMYVYDGDSVVFSFVASTGIHNATKTGSFSVLDKIPNAYGSTWDIWMPNWLGIYWAGTLENGIHALPILPNGATLWAGFLGEPISYGCVVLGTAEAQELYDWADVGTPVNIQW